MEYCLGDGDGSATLWTAPPDTDVDGDGVLEAVGLDFDGDGLTDDAMADLDGDGVAEHAVLDLGAEQSYFSDDGSGTWTVNVDRGGQVRWFGLDGVEQTGGPVVDVDGDGEADDRLVDADGDGLADQALSADAGYVDIDGDGRWDVRLVDTDGDGRADAVGEP